MKKPGESLSGYVRRRVPEEGPMTAAQEKAAFINGDEVHEGAAVVMALGGEGNTQAAILSNNVAPIPIIDCTEKDAGAGFVIGLGADMGEPHGRANRSQEPTSGQDTPTPNESGTRSEPK